MEGFEVLEAKNGNEGVEIARTRHPDLIFCDIQMPELDGHGVLQKVREDAKTLRTPFVFLTARGEKTDVRAGMNLGADDYLVKPVAVEDLLSAVQTRLERSRQLSTTDAEGRKPSPEMLIPLGLTEREAETLFWVAQGKSNSDLCILLGVRLTTIKKHLERIFQKLGAENRTSAAAIALEKLSGR